MQAHQISNRRNATVVLAVAMLALFALVACGGDDNDAPAAGATPTQAPAEPGSDDAGNSIVLNTDQTYSIEDFEAAGYKKVTRFDPELLDGVTDAWLGFFNQRDIEIWVYPSHQVALDVGVELAEVAVGKPAGDPRQKQIRFDAYAVVGNVVMLCELEVASCEALITQLD